MQVMNAQRKRCCNNEAALDPQCRHSCAYYSEVTEHYECLECGITLSGGWRPPEDRGPGMYCYHGSPFGSRVYVSNIQLWGYPPITSGISNGKDT